MRCIRCIINSYQLGNIMPRYLPFTFEGARGTVTSSGFVQWRTLSCQHDALIGSLRDMVNATMARMI